MCNKRLTLSDFVSSSRRPPALSTPTGAPIGPEMDLSPPSWPCPRRGGPRTIQSGARRRLRRRGSCSPLPRVRFSPFHSPYLSAFMPPPAPAPSLAYHPHTPTSRCRPAAPRFLPLFLPPYPTTGPCAESFTLAVSHLLRNGPGPESHPAMFELLQAGAEAHAEVRVEKKLSHPTNPPPHPAASQPALAVALALAVAPPLPR